MKKERLFILKVSVVLAIASLAIAAAVWAIIIWQLGRPYQMPFLTSLQTAAPRACSPEGSFSPRCSSSSWHGFPSARG